MDSVAKLTPAELQQRQQAALKHGVDAYRLRGTDALEPVQRSREVELREQVDERGGVLDLMKQRAARAVLIAELAEAHVAGQVEAGIPFDKIPLTNRISTFQEAGRRALADLFKVLPEDGRKQLNEVMNGTNVQE